MAYIGKQPVVGNFVKLDAIVTSATATYNLLNGGVAYFPQTANNCIVSLNGVIQSPTSAYTISGSTIVFSDALTSSDTIDFILVLGDVLSIGTPSDNTVSLTKLTATGTKDSSTFLRGDNTFASAGTSWQSVQTTGFTAVAGRGYPCNTTSAGFTVTLPASPSVGDYVQIVDYAGTFDTNNLTINPNGLKIEGVTSGAQLKGEREGVLLVYVDATQGWLATSGINEGTDALEPVTYSADFLVIAGGGGGGGDAAGGGGAGGYRSSNATYGSSGGGGSAESSITLNGGTVYTITVGGGGAGNASAQRGTNGTNSSISGTGLSTITSTGGGGGGGSGNRTGASGGSGGGGAVGISGNQAGGSGTANQGYAGGTANAINVAGAGGGGAAAVGGSTSGTATVCGAGGAGTASTITGSSVTRAGGGGGGGDVTGGAGGAGGGGTGAASAGTDNTGGGGGGATGSGNAGYNAGSGVVILRMPTSLYSGTTTGSPTVTTSGSDTILTFNASGTYTG